MSHTATAAAPTPVAARPLLPARERAFVRCPRRIRRALGWHRRAGHGVAFTPLALLVAAALATTSAMANPSGAQVVSGQVQVVGSVPGTLDIHQGTNKAIIHWQSFNIASGETVNFLQPSRSSVTLNRVLGNDPSAIFGRLTANGTVLLVNPNGVVFGPTARLDVGGLVASTANIRDDDFLAGRYRFGEASANAQAGIVNAGEISIRDNGLAALVAPRVSNSGVIQARLGRVMLGGAAAFTLDFQGDGLLSFAAGAAPLAQVVNTGTLSADGGTVMLGASAVKGVVDQVINTSGLVSATTVSGTPGRIVLAGGDSGTVAVNGSLLADGGAAGTGGRVSVNGAHVQLGAAARIDTSGGTGGGEIALGSDGRDTGYARKSLTTDVDRGARLHADARVTGDGGHITLWSQDTTRFAGSLSARGGAQGGHGGFAEISSQKNLGLTGQVDLGAARGASGTLLLDPTDLRITDSASGGSQDSNAGDNTVAAADANQGSGTTLNTVSRGQLESLSGSANVVLQATGQITVDAMAGGTLNLATTAGHGFTLQSTQSGGIRFVDAATEIRTQGGDITLLAQGAGSTLSNIGKLSSNGGAITLKSAGLVEVAGALNAGSGTVRLESAAGSIARAAGASPLLSGGRVELTAPAGHVGATGQPIQTHTPQLTIASGGHAVATSDQALTALSLDLANRAGSASKDYQVSAPGLAFQVSDGSALAIDQIAQAAGLNLTIASDRTLQLGTVNVGPGALSLTATAGDLLGTAQTALTAGTLALHAQGSTGANGAIGSSGQPLLTAAGRLTATAGSGGAQVSNTGALALDQLIATGASTISSSGTLTVAHADTGTAALTLASTGGSVLDDGSTATSVTASTLSLSAGGAIGSSGARLATNASTLSANAGAGGIVATTTATSSVLSSIVSGDGPIDIRTGGSTTLTSLSSTTSSAANPITVTATGTGSMSVGTVNAGALGDVTLATTSGSIFGNTGLITGNRASLNAANSGSVTVRTAASTLDVQAGSSSISITQTGAVTLERISTPSSLASVTSSSGDITVGAISTSSSGQVTLTASAGSILEDGNAATRISTGTASLSASAAVGTPALPVQTKATGLAVTSTGDLLVTNTDATLTSLSITNRHSAPGNAATLQVNSPYLTFDVTDTGTSYTLDRLVSVPLGSLAFNGDATLQLGQVQAAGSVNLTATQGHIVDDGNLNSRVTAGSTLTLSAAQGSVGSSSNPIGVNASSLVLTTRGDLYVDNIADLATLTITSTHPDTTTSYGMAIKAPSLHLQVSDSAAGHAVQTLVDNSSLSLTFTSDRDITLGQVDLTHTGTARFTSSAGVIKDDGDKSTRVLANSSTFSGLAVGASGVDHLDVVTGTLAATATAGGVFVQVPMPTGSTNTNSTVTLGTVSAAGPVAITALEGDLSLGGFLTATNQAISLTATQGSILSPIGYSVGIGGGSLTLNAGTAIGASDRALPITSSAGATLTAQAGTAMFASSSGPMTLSSLQAPTGITYTQNAGDITVGAVDASAASNVSISTTTGAIRDDGNGATGIRGAQVTLSAAQGSIGSGTAIAVDTPRLVLSAMGDIGVADSATLDSLSITRSSNPTGTMAITAGAGQVFALDEENGTHHLHTVTSTTPLAFGFTGPYTVKIGQVDVGAAGSATIASAADIVNIGSPGDGIAAGTVSLTSGTNGSIGTSWTGATIALTGTTALTLSTGQNAYVSSSSALTDLAITSTNTTTAAGTASLFGLSATGQTFAITDSGSTQSLDFAGTALNNFAFTTRKNIQAGAITATGDVTLATSGGGANSNISSDSGSGTIAGNRVLLTATSSTAGGGSIGSSGSALRVDTPTVILSGSGNIYLNDAQNLTRLDMTVTHGTNTSFGYGVTAGNLNSFAITDGNTQSLGMSVTGAMDFAYSVDRALSLSTVDAGTSTTGSIALTSRSAPTGTGAQINRSSGSLTGGTITLSAAGTNGGVGAGATLSTNTKNLSIASGGNVSVSNSTTLTSLSLDAQHHTSGSSTHSYSISSTGLTFSISDTLGNTGFRLANISQSSLELSLKADRVITASSVNTGAGGKVTLHSASYVQGGSGASAGSPSITTGDLTLNGGSAFGYQGSTPLYTAAGTLSSNLTNTLYLSNAGALTLKTNTVGGSADVASSNNSLLQGAGGLFTTPTLKLSANQSLGSTGSLLTDARRLTLVARNHIDVSNASDLYALTMTSTHGTAGVQNTVSVAAPRLNLALTDSVGGDQYHLSNLVDSTGIDFTLSTDVALNLGTVNAQAGRALALYSTGTTTSITNDGSSLLQGGSILLSAGGSVGAAGGSGTRMQTDTRALTIATGADAYVDNAKDLISLSLTSSQTAGGTAPVYQVTAPALSFDVTDDGATHINHVADSTGLNFVLNTRRDQAVDTIDLGRSGTVSLTSTGDILGDADSSHRVTAASATFFASNGGAIGSVGNPIRLSAPIASFAPTGALNVDSDTHIDQLAISTTHPTVTYGGTYSIVSVPIAGAAYPLFTATDSVTGTALTSLDDPLGLAFSFTSDRAIQVGTLNLGTTGTVALTGTGSGGILGDGDANTRVQAASLSMVSYGGAVGASGSGNGIDATVQSLSAAAQGGGVNLALHGPTALGSISSTGGIGITNDEGDIALGAINAGGNAFTIDNAGGSILSGSIFNSTTVSLTASGSIGNVSDIGTSANGGGTTTLTASASAAHGAAGSVTISESYNLLASSVTAPAAVTLSSGYDLLAGTITSGAAVALSSSQGSINGSSGSNAISGTAIELSARYGSSNGIGSAGTRLNVNSPQLVLNTPGSVYVTDSADLNRLTIDRTNYTGGGSAGTLSVLASNLTLSATDSADTTTLTTVVDSTGLDFTYLGIGALAVGNINVGTAGSVLLQGYLSSGDGHIDAIDSSSLIRAGTVTLQAYGTDSRIGSSATPLGLAAGTLIASSGTGGIHLQQAGSLNLSSLSTTGDLQVSSSSGDLTLGTLSYNAAGTLDLTASGGSILAGGSTLAGTGSAATMNLSAAHGIGTALAPIRINASAGHAVNASVTGTGSLYLDSLGTMNGGLTTAVNDGATNVTAAGAIKLQSMSTGTDAEGNDIRVRSRASDITVVSVSGGAAAEFTTVDLAALGGRLLVSPGATLEAAEVLLHGATGVGDSSNRVSAIGQRMQISSGGGNILLAAPTATALTSVNAHGGTIDILQSAHLQLGSVATEGGNLTVSSTAPNVDLFAGNLDAGGGTVTLSATGAGSRLLDDGNPSSTISGGTVSLTAAGGVGRIGAALQTRAASLSVSSGNGIVIDDSRTAGVQLASIVASDGAVSITSTGPMTATAVQAQTDLPGNDVTLHSTGGDITAVDVRAGSGHGAISLTAAGAIAAGGAGPQLRAHRASLTAGGDIGAGTPLVVQLGSGALALSGTTAAITTTGDLDLSSGLHVTGNLSLIADGVLTVPAVSSGGAVTLSGGTDVLGSGATPRALTVSASSLTLGSGAAGGDTQLLTTVGSLQASLAGAGKLTVSQTGTLAGATLSTTDGDITLTSSGAVQANIVVAGGANRRVQLTAASGDLTAGTVDAGSAGRIELAATAGTVNGAAAALTAASLGLSSGVGIGSAATPFVTDIAQVDAQVTGSGGIYLSSPTALTLGTLATNGGDIAVAATGVIQLGSVTTTGAQRYTGALTLTGDLSGSQLLVDGPLTLAGGARRLTGDLHVTGAIAGGGFAATLNGGAGGVVLDGAATGLGSLTVQATQIQLGSVTTSGAQSYQGATTLNGSYLTGGGAFEVLGTAQLAGTTQVDTGAGAARFGGTLGGAQALTVNSSGATRFDGAVTLQSLATDAAGSLAIHGGSVTTTGTQQYGEHVVLGSDLALTASRVTLAQGADAATPGQQGLSITGPAQLPVALGSQAALKSLVITGDAVLDGGSVTTTGAQRYDGALSLGQATTLTGTGLAFGGAIDGAVGLTLTAGSGDVQIGAAIGHGTRLQALTVNGSGSTQLGGDVRTAGAQRYGSAVVLTGDRVLEGTGVAFDGAIDGAQRLRIDAGSGDARLGGRVGAITRLGELTITSSGATTLTGSVQAASVTTDAPGTLALNGGTVDTTGAQSWGERAILGTDTVLSGSRVSLLAGVDATVAGGQSLEIVGDASLGAGIGTQRALSQLRVRGASTWAAGDVQTTGDLRIDGDANLLADQAWTSTQGSINLSGRVDSTGGANLTLASDAGAVAVEGAVGATDALGALTVRAATTADFGGQIRAYRLHQTVGGQSHFLGTVWVNGIDGIELRGASVRFEQAVTATDGALNVALTDPAGILGFASAAALRTSLGFTQSGGASVELPASVVVTPGPIVLAAPARLPAGTAQLEAGGAITLPGLSGTSTALTLAAGTGAAAAGGVLAIGLDDGNPAHLLDVSSLTVPRAASAQVYGRIAGQGGAVTATLVRGGLLGAPYFANGTPWGPQVDINALVATTVPPSVVPRVMPGTLTTVVPTIVSGVVPGIAPSTPATGPLFTHRSTTFEFVPSALRPETRPQVLQVLGEAVNTTGASR